MDPFMEDVARRSPQEDGSTNEERGRVWHSRQSEKHNPRRRNPQPRMLSAGVGRGGEGVGRAESGSSWCVLPRGMAWRIEGDPRIVLGAPPNNLLVSCPACDAGGARDMGWIPGSERSTREGNGTPVFLLGNPMDRGAWQVPSMRSQRVRHDWTTKEQQILSLPHKNEILALKSVLTYKNFSFLHIHECV